MTTSAASKKSDPVASVCLLLAELFSTEIDEKTLKMLRLPEVRSVMELMVPEMREILDENWNDDNYEAHDIEFCRLFIYPAVCAPFAEKWARNLGDEQFSVRRWFESREVPDLPPRLAELPDSHVAKILFVRAGLAEAEPSVKTQYDQQMILPWAARYAEGLESHSELPIYRATAGIIAALESC